MITEADKEALETIQSHDVVLVNTELSGILVTAIAVLTPKDANGDVGITPLAVIVNPALFELLKKP